MMGRQQTIRSCPSKPTARVLLWFVVIGVAAVAGALLCWRSSEDGRAARDIKRDGQGVTPTDIAPSSLEKGRNPRDAIGADQSRRVLSRGKDGTRGGSKANVAQTLSELVDGVTSGDGWKEARTARDLLGLLTRDSDARLSDEQLRRLEVCLSDRGHADYVIAKVLHILWLHGTPEDTLIERTLALARESGAAQTMAIRLLGRMRSADSSIEATLLAVLASLRSAGADIAHLHSVTCQALASRPSLSHGAVLRLIAGLDSNDRRFQGNVVGALERLCRGAHCATREAAEEVWARLPTLQSRLKVRVIDVYGAMTVSSPEGRDNLLGLLMSQDATARAAAVKGLAYHVPTDRIALTAVGRALSDSDTDVRENAARVLLRRGVESPQVDALIVAYVRHEHEYGAQEPVCAFGALISIINLIADRGTCSPTIHAELFRIGASDGTTELRSAALEAYVRTQGGISEVVPIFAELLKTEGVADIQAEVALTIGRIVFGKDLDSIRSDDVATLLKEREAARRIFGDYFASDAELVRLLRELAGMSDELRLLQRAICEEH